MLSRIYEVASKVAETTTFVIGHDKNSLIDEFKTFEGNFNFSEQAKPLGTADAVKSSLSMLSLIHI